MEYNKREWQLFEVSILDKVVAICEKYNISYFLSSGTLLGAVRHKGFIPWDDDIDIDMPIKDYKKFCKVAPKELELGGCFLQTYKTDPEASLSWAMVRANNTTSLPVSCYKWNIHWGVHVDIFPLIGLYNNKSLRALQYKLFGLSRTLLEKDYITSCCPEYRLSSKVKVLYMLPRFVRHGLVSVFDIFIDRDFYGAEESTVKWWNLATKYNPKFYHSVAMLEFEDRKYAAPINYDGQLTLLYGDYMTPPPEAEREGHELIQGSTIRDLDRDYRLYQRKLMNGELG